MLRGRWVELALVGALLAGGLGLRVALAHDYVFAGSDSYGYLKLADELTAHGRYALGPPPEPLHFARTPLYPLFVAAVKGNAHADMNGGPGWNRITLAQALVDGLVTGLMVFFVARRLGGRKAGLLALGLGMFMPFSLIPVGAALTECLAMALTTLSVGTLILGRNRPRCWFPVAGVLLGLSTLLRPDGVLPVLAFAPALWLIRPARERLIVGALALAGFAVAFGPWPARNLYRFGHPYAFGSRVDRHSNPILNWEGPHHFIQSFGRDWETFNSSTNCLFDRACTLPLDQLEQKGAFEGAEDRAALVAALAERSRSGFTEDVSRRFEELASHNRRRHPLRVYVWLPLWRAAVMWIDPFDEILQKPPLPGLYRFVKPLLPPVPALLFVALLVGGATLLSDRRTRPGGLVLVAAIAGRTAVLAVTFYCMPRYIREVLPLAYVVVAVGGVEAGRRIIERARARRAVAPTVASTISTGTASIK